MPVSELRGGPRGAPWTDRDRLLMLGLQAYEDDLCQGCGWPRTYTMHRDARGHFHSSGPIPCHACIPKNAAEDAAAKGDHHQRGTYYAARPDEGIWHAMSDPILTYEDDSSRWVTGASGYVYPPTALPDDD